MRSTGQPASTPSSDLRPLDARSFDGSPYGNRMKTVYTVVDRGGKSFWVKVGVGFVNRDGSINLRLDAVPVNGTLQVRDYEPFPDADRSRADASDDGDRARFRNRSRDGSELFA